MSHKKKVVEDKVFRNNCNMQTTVLHEGLRVVPPFGLIALVLLCIYSWFGRGDCGLNDVQSRALPFVGLTPSFLRGKARHGLVPTSQQSICQYAEFWILESVIHVKETARFHAQTA
jgi:hypothetical protein